MEEIWDILDENGNQTGETMKKEYNIKPGIYHQGADVWIINSDNKILIQKRSPRKKLSPGVWAMTGGSVIKGETSKETIKRETKEELNIDLEIENMNLIKKYRTGNVWLDVYMIRKDINLDDVIMQEDEVVEVKWASCEEIDEIYKNNQFIENRWEFVRNIMRSIQYIGKSVEVKIDRPLGSEHPKYPGHIYPINYGFVPNTISGDGEELDCYILGENVPLKTYQGKCISVIHRLEEDDDKLIIVPEGKQYNTKQIKELTNFQEKYYKNTIIM